MSQKKTSRRSKKKKDSGLIYRKYGFTPHEMAKLEYAVKKYHKPSSTRILRDFIARLPEPEVEYPIIVNGVELNHIGDSVQVGDPNESGIHEIKLTGQPIIVEDNPQPTSTLQEIVDSRDHATIEEPQEEEKPGFWDDIEQPKKSDFDREIGNVASNGWTDKLWNSIFKKIEFKK